MNYPVVNLIKKGERRYQGAISRRFLFISLVVTPILCIAILSGIKLVQFNSINSQLLSCREQWTDLQPRQDLFFQEKKALETNRQILDLIYIWEGSQIAFPDLLQDIRQRIPDSIQLTHLVLESKMETSVFKNAEELKLNCSLALQGLSNGDWAEDAVIALRKDLLKSTAITGVFESIELASMRKQSDKTGQSVREFSLKASRDNGAVQ